MRIIDHLRCADHHDVVAIQKGESLWVNRMIPNHAITEGLVRVFQPEKSNSRLITAKFDLIMLVKYLHESGKGCLDILHIRKDRHCDEGLCFAGACDIPENELRKIISLLKKNQVPRIQILGGFEGAALIYPNLGEMSIPDIDSPSLTTGWITSEAELAILKNPPPITAKTTEVKKNLIDDAATKKAITKLAIDAQVAIRLEINARVVAIRLANEANKAEDAANAASKVATTAFTAFTEAVAKTTNKTA